MSLEVIVSKSKKPLEPNSAALLELLKNACIEKSSGGLLRILLNNSNAKARGFRILAGTYYLSKQTGSTDALAVSCSIKTEESHVLQFEESNPLLATAKLFSSRAGKYGQELIPSELLISDRRSWNFS